MRFFLAMSLFATITGSFTSCAFAQEKRTIVNIETSLGDIKVELNDSAAPISCFSFHFCVSDNLYDRYYFSVIWLRYLLTMIGIMFLIPIIFIMLPDRVM